MTPNDKRFQAALFAMKLFTYSDTGNDTPEECAKDAAKAAVLFGDALIAELERTEPTCEDTEECPHDYWQKTVTGAGTHAESVQATCSRCGKLLGVK